MADLPPLDPQKLYNKAMGQIQDLTSQALQMDEMIDLLKGQIDTLTEERDKAIEERDDARLELKNMLTLTENETLQKSNEDSTALET